MSFDYINEAFKKLDVLEESMFDLSVDGIEALSDFLDIADSVDTVDVIDPNVSDVEDLEDSYIGKVITNCNICHSNIFNNKEDIEINDDGVVNPECACPYCGECEGFVIVGEIAPFSPAADVAEESIPDEEPSEEPADVVEDNVEELPEDTSDEATEEEPVEEDEEDMNENMSVSMSRATKRAINEGINELLITTDDTHMEMLADEDGKITIVSEPVVTEEITEDPAETIAPLSDETTEEIIENNEAEELPEEPVEDYEEFDFDEIDEESFNELGEAFLQNVYENVASFKTTSVGANDSAILVEGVITFNSGVEKHTGFVFEAKDVNSRGQLRFSGLNEHFSKENDCFSLVGRVDNNKLFVESLKYNYTVNDNSVRGIVRRK